jgi:hypothetical protein
MTFSTVETLQNLKVGPEGIYPIKEEANNVQYGGAIFTLSTECSFLIVQWPTKVVQKLLLLYFAEESKLVLLTSA